MELECKLWHLRRGGQEVFAIQATRGAALSISCPRLASEVDADKISSKLASQWPPSEYPVHIQIVDGVAGEAISVRVWNSSGVKESEIVYPADYAECEDPITAAAIEEIKFIVTRLLMEGEQSGHVEGILTEAVEPYPLIAGGHPHRLYDCVFPAAASPRRRQPITFRTASPTREVVQSLRQRRWCRSTIAEQVERCRREVESCRRAGTNPNLTTAERLGAMQ